MSDTDSFIDEVSEELRRDQLFAKFKRYGWIAALAVVLLVGGAAFNEYRKSQDRAQAEALGDSLMAALSTEDTSARAAALSGINATAPRAAAVVDMLAAAEHLENDDVAAAVARLDAVAINGEVPLVYRQLAGFKSVTLQSDTMPLADRRIAFENLAQPGSALRLLAAEQLALIEIEAEAPDAAIERYQTILDDAELTPDLQQRALQVIVALGGEPKMREPVQLDTDDASQTGDN